MAKPSGEFPRFFEPGQQIESVEEGREIIDRIDDQILDFISQRLHTAIAIGAFRRETGDPSTFDIQREFAVIGRLEALNGGPLTDMQLSEIYHTIFGVTKQVQATAAQEWRASQESPQAAL